MTVRAATLADLSACLAIYNYWVEEGVSTFDEQPWTPGEGVLWYSQHQDKHYPLLVMEVQAEVVGWGSLSRWSAKSGYQQTAEVSLFLAPDQLGSGHGKTLLARLVKAANQSRHHLLIARIEASNEHSVTLFRKAGFEPVGLMREAGFKNRRWLDVYVMEKVLSRRARV